ncbi:MAG: dockerin type I domain-containing protein, partial [Armatimonadota bacterium]|nr:dockerin type I domain-containing protein [Armatimonadota bacterium]
GPLLDDVSLIELPTTVAIRGRVTLEEFLGDLTRVPVTVELRQGGVALRVVQVNLDAEGNYTIPDVEAGTYDLAFKASHWLRKVVEGVVVTGAADVTGVDVSLVNGDVNGDNEVSLLDFGAFVAAFGSTPGDTVWNPDADLNGDEEVNLLDFGVLVRSFGEVGDE